MLFEGPWGGHRGESDTDAAEDMEWAPESEFVAFSFKLF